MNRNRPRLMFVATRLLLDACALVLALQAAYATRFHWAFFTDWFPVTKGIPSLDLYQHSFLILLPFFLVIFHLSGSYRSTLQTAYDEFIQVLQAVVWCALLSVAVTYAFRNTDYSRIVTALWTLYAALFVFGLRELHKIFFRKLTLRFAGPQRALVIGKGKAMDAIRSMSKNEPFVKPIYLEDVPSPTVLRQRIVADRISNVILIQGPVHAGQILELSRVCEDLDVECQVVPDLFEIRRGEIIFNGFCGLPTFHIRPLSLHGGNYVLKRGFDLCVSLALLAVFSVPILIVAILIKLDSKGPILYTQDRMGWRGRTFKVYKFRTMVQDADARLEKIKHLSDRPGPVFKMKKDPRITKVGKFLRKFSIDELPQILNVIRGDMSLVGPRPQVLWEAAVYDDHAKKRLRILPGITGLWQVSGRAHLSYEEMIDLDVYYLENWSLGLDLKILLRTLPAVFAKEGAY